MQMKPTNMIDYILWRGDLSFYEVKFCPIDILIFAEMSYCPLEKVNPRFFGRTLKEIKDELFKPITPARLIFDKRINKDVYPFNEDFQMLWKTMDSRKRFASCTLASFESSFDKEKSEQFAAAVFGVGDTAIVAFRGTDSTIVGWKEDFNLSLEEPVPAQIKSVDFLERNTKSFKRIIVTGHSKGGNLAMYSASCCSSKTRKKISQVISFDGPGLSSAVLVSEGWQEIKSRVQSYIPEYSIVGLLLGYCENYKVITSESVSILQHNAFNWHVMGSDFVFCDDVAKSSEEIKTRLQQFLSKCPVPQRRILVNTVFDIIELAGAKRINDIPMAVTTHINAISKYISNISDENKNALKEMFRIFTEKEYGQNLLPPTVFKKH